MDDELLLEHVNLYCSTFDFRPCGVSRLSLPHSSYNVIHNYRSVSSCRACGLHKFSPTIPSMSSDAFDAWNKLTVNALKKELETRNASVKTLTLKEQLINRLIRFESGTTLEDDIVSEVPPSKPPPYVPSQPGSDYYGMIEDDDVALLPTTNPTAQDDEFGIDSDNEAFEELAIKVESPSLKRSADEDPQSPAKRQCKLEGMLQQHIENMFWITRVQVETGSSNRPPACWW